MTERLLLVSTCGTSLLTNGASEDDRTWLTSVANDEKVDGTRLTPIVEDRRARLAVADNATRRKMSAELNGIGAVLDRSATSWSTPTPRWAKSLSSSFKKFSARGPHP